ncbi:hypothetical protein BDV29DRAFT_162456 [Aspergillus leporis]|uniref:Uncharacterized protein n=1 Tax=Aspergillus leporis TaxID=41062 RepID=A0A5N5WM38_9EURO|nr:hypothetical protein BDV29DRAFT_162456 [Aspergillus leporis]
MGQSRVQNWLLLAATRPQGTMAATIPIVTAALTSLTTITSTFTDTVINTITSLSPITTTILTCTPGTAAHISCANSLWSNNGAYWQEWCSTASVTEDLYVALNAPNPYVCFIYYSVYASSCTAAKCVTFNRACSLLGGSMSTVSASGVAAIVRLTTNTCIVTVTASFSTSLSTETSVA